MAKSAAAKSQDYGGLSEYVAEVSTHRELKMNIGQVVTECTSYLKGWLTEYTVQSARLSVYNRPNWVHPFPQRQANVAPPSFGTKGVTNWLAGKGGTQFRRRYCHSGTLCKLQSLYGMAAVQPLQAVQFQFSSSVRLVILFASFSSKSGQKYVVLHVYIANSAFMKLSHEYSQKRTETSSKVRKQCIDTRTYYYCTVFTCVFFV